MAIFKLPSSEDTFEKIIKSCRFSSEDGNGKSSPLLDKSIICAKQCIKNKEKLNGVNKNYKLLKEVVIKEKLKSKTHQTINELSNQNLSQMTYSQFIKGITKTSTQDQSEYLCEKSISFGNHQKKLDNFISKNLVNYSSNSSVVSKDQCHNGNKCFNKLVKKGNYEIGENQNFKKGIRCISLRSCLNEKKFQCVNLKNCNVRSQLESVKNFNYLKRRGFKKLLNDRSSSSATADIAISTHNESSRNLLKKNCEKLNYVKKYSPFSLQNRNKSIYQDKLHLKTIDKKLNLKAMVVLEKLNISKSANCFNAVFECNNRYKLKGISRKNSVSEKGNGLSSFDVNSAKKIFRTECKQNFQNRFQEDEFSSSKSVTINFCISRNSEHEKKVKKSGNCSVVENNFFSEWECVSNLSCDGIRGKGFKLNSCQRSKIEGVRECNKGKGTTRNCCSEMDFSAENRTVRIMNNFLQPGNRRVQTPVISDSGNGDNLTIDTLYRALQIGCIKSYGFIREIIPSLKGDLKEDAVQFSCHNCIKTFTYSDVQNTFCVKEMSCFCPANCNFGLCQKIPAAFSFKFIIRDLAGMFSTYVLIGKEAENLFGCTVNNFWHSRNTRNSVRRAIRNLMRSYHRKILNEFCISTENLFGSGPKYLVNICKKSCVTPGTRMNF